MPHTALMALILCLATGATYAKFEVTTSSSPVAVKPGEDVTLSCILTVDKPPIELKDLMVQWFHRGKQIAEYDNKITFNRPDVSFTEEALKKGNISLFIAKAKVEHSGNYRCYVYYKSNFQMKEIVVTVEDPTQAKEEEAEPVSIPDTRDEPETLRWVKLVKVAVDGLQQTMNMMKTDVEKCAASPNHKAPKP